MKKNLFLSLMLCCFSQYASAFSGGDGSERSPYIITTAEELMSIPDGSPDYFILGADIPSVGGTGKAFCGNFDGNGHSITLEQRYSAGEYSSEGGTVEFGLFTKCTGAYFVNLTINGTQNIKTRNQVKGYETASYWNKFSNINWYFYFYLTQTYIGSICGQATSTTFKNCTSNTSISFAVASYIPGDNHYLGIASDSWFGGLVGYATNCNFSECSATGTITTDLVADKRRDTWGPCGIYSKVSMNGAGGLAGGIRQTEISDCFSTISITDEDKISLGAGGIVGYAYNSNLQNSYSRCSITNYGYSIGSIVYAGDSKIENCVANSTNIQPTSNDLKFVNCYTTTDEETEQLKKVDSEYLSIQQWYAQNCPQWDFENVWYLPAATDAMPQFRIEPTITWEGNMKYGSAVTFKSSNPYASIEILTDNINDITVAGNSITFNKAGEFKMTIIQNAVSPYKSINKTFTFNAEKLPLSVIAKNIEIEYGNSPDLNDILVFDGFINNDNPNSLKSLPDVYCGATNKSDAGTYSILLQGGDADNYDLILTNGQLTVTPRTLEVVPRNCSRQYGSPNPEFAIDFNGFVDGQDECMITEYPIVTTRATEYSSTGEYTLVCSGGSVHPNYKFAYKSGLLTINKAKLIISADDKDRGVGELNPSFTVSYSGFRNNDNEFSLDELPLIKCDADINSPSGQYAIELEGGFDKNYEYRLQNGILIVHEQAGIQGNFSGDVPKVFNIYNLQGNCIKRNARQADIDALVPGFYIINGIKYVK